MKCTAYFDNKGSVVPASGQRLMSSTVAMDTDRSLSTHAPAVHGACAAQWGHV